jgi:ectoine hydroxylase-related dioxygenase (phytanoyl-CoA dioxygenase family)
MPLPHATRDLTAEEVTAFQRDGVALLKALFDPAWIEELEQAVDFIMAHPTPHAVRLVASYADDYLARYNADFARISITDSPGPGVAAQLIGSPSINLIFDSIIVKEPGEEGPTPWHHDLPYYPLTGRQLVSLWVPVDPVTLHSGGVRYVAGSHEWGLQLRPESFNFDAAYAHLDLPPVPDIDADEEQYDIVSWDLQPGDCVAHHGLTVHSAGGNLSQTRRRRAFVVRYAGEDIRWAGDLYEARFGKPFTRLPWNGDLSEGSPLDPEVFPLAWPRAG